LTLVAISNKYKTKRKEIKRNKARVGIQKTSYDNVRIILKGGGGVSTNNSNKDF